MANLSLKHLYKVYPNGTKAVSDFNMEIKDKEFIVFVGPSGCGKSTTLRMIAGLEDISAGELFIGDTLVNDIEPKDRDIAMVFQNYALYPHMTVYDNMAFGLKLRHIPDAEIHEKILWAAKILGISDYLDRKPKAMSGGQRQRVALGRAILRNPKVFLLDEPLSNLDAKLRTQMRSEISKIHKELGTTFIYVTHDQVEAMTMGSRIVVMKLGRVQQIDTPKNLYNYPENKFVAGFIGTPQMNFFNVSLLKDKDNVNINFKDCDDKLTIPFNSLLKVMPNYFNGNRDVVLGVRCEHISIDPEIVKKSKNIIKVKVSHFEDLGSETLVYGDLDMEGNGYDESNTRIIIKSFSNKLELSQGDVIDAAIDINYLHFFDKETEESIAPRLPKVNLFDVSVEDNILDLLGNKIALPEAIKVENANNIEMLLPCDAISFDGDIDAEVVLIEEINEQKLIHLKINDRVFFAYGDKDYKVGDKVKIAIDFTRIEMSVNGKEIVKPLEERDSILVGFTSQATLKSSKKTYEKFVITDCNKQVETIIKEQNNALNELRIDPEIPKILKKEYKEKLSIIKAEEAFQLQKGELGKDGKVKVKNKAKEEIAKATKEYQEGIAKFNENKNRLLGLSNEEKAKLDEKAKVISVPFEERINEIKSYLDEFKKVINNHDKALLNESKELKHEALNEFNAFKEKNLAELKEKTNISTLEEFNKLQGNVEFSERQGFFMYNGFYFKCSESIENKMIQALQSNTFNSIYRIEINHDAYTISNDENDLEATVVDKVDYGNKKFVKCETIHDTLYVLSDKDYKKGEKIRLKIDVNNCQLYENHFDIRLH